MSSIEILDDLVLRILRSNRHKLLACLGEIFQGVDLIRILASDRYADDAGSNVVFRENVFLFAGRCLPDPLRSCIVLAGFDADQKIIIRCRHILEFIPRQLLCHFLHDSDFHAVRLILVIHIVVWEIVRRVRDLHDFLSIGRYSSRCSLVCLFTAASCKPSRDSHDACQNECFP